MISTEFLAEGLNTTVIGFVFVITVLLLIAFLLSMLSKIIIKAETLNKQKSENKALSVEQKNDTVTENKAPVIEIQEEAPIQQQDDMELIAVITAAVAASMNTTTDKLIVRSFRKVPAWNKAAVSENQNKLYD